MRTAVDALDVLASRTLLPAEDETVELSTRRPDQPIVAVPAFARDPRFVEGMPARLGRRIDRFAALAYRSVCDLVEPLDMPPADRVGVFFANTRAGWTYAEPQMDAMLAEGPRRVAPYFVTAWFPTAATGEVTIGLGYRGISKTTTGRESGFAEALWLARDALERRAIDVAIVGAVESVVTPFAMLDWAEDLPMPTRGPAEGAVVFALRPATTSEGGPTLRDLRYDDTDRTSGAARDWIPTLSIAASLAADVHDVGDDVDVALGGGYRVTVANRSRAAVAA